MLGDERWREGGRKRNLNGKSNRKDARIADGVDKRKIEEQEETEGNLLKQLDARFLLKRQIRKGIERRQRETTDPFVWDEVNATDTVALTARR